ncbi:MAG TPA: hypothetical protein VLW50_00115 [Streptosporangiaceae bacterium]|nr:hypothetical protein [Streptosporangiaceae bacterium]
MSCLQRAARAGAAGRGERVQADGEGAVRGGDVAAGGEGFADQGVRFVVCAGVGAVQRAGQDGLGVIGGHPDGVGNQLGLGIQPDQVRVVLRQRDLRGDGLGGRLGIFEPLAGCGDRGVEPGELLVGDEGFLAGGGGAHCGERGVAGGLGCGEVLPGGCVPLVTVMFTVPSATS